MSLIRNTAWSAVAAIVLTGGRFLISVLLANKLGTTEFGKFAFSQWLVDMVFLSLAFGLPGSAARFFAEFRVQSSNLLAFQRWFLLRSLAVVAVVTLASPLIALASNDEFDPKLILLQATWSASAAAWGLLLARAQGLQQFKRVTLSNGVYVVSALACLFYPGHMNIYFAVLLVTVATIAAALVLVNRLPFELTRSNIIVRDANINAREISRFGVNIWLTGLVGALVWSRGEIAIVRTQLGVSEVAIYATALSLVGIAAQGVMLLTGAIGPHLTQMWGAGKHKEAIELCRRITDMLMLLGAVLSIFLVVFSTDLIRLSFGAEYLQAEFALAILGLGAIGLVSSAANQLLQINTNGVFARNVNLVGGIGILVLAIPLVRVLGVDGAAIARAIVQCGVGAATLYFATKIISPVAVNWKNQAKAASLLACVFIIEQYIDGNLYVRMLEFLVSIIGLILWLRQDDGTFIVHQLLLKIAAIFRKQKYS